MRYALAALLLVGCAWTPAYRADRVRKGLIDLPERRLVGCLGAPQAMVADTLEGPRYWVYALPVPEGRGQDVVIEADIEGTPSPSARRGPRVVQGDLTTETLTEEFRRNPSATGLPPGWCRLTFEVAAGRVRSLSARGSSRDELNADAACLQALSHCVPD